MLIKRYLQFRSPTARKIFLIIGLILIINYSRLLSCFFSFSLEKVVCSKEVSIIKGARSSLLTDNQTYDSDNLTIIHQDLFNYLAASLNNTIEYPGIDVYISYTTALMRLKPLPNVEPIRKDLGPAINDVTSFYFPIQIEKCVDKFESTNKSVFIAIISAPDNFVRREHIRKTWFNHLKDSFFHRNLVDFIGFSFFLGTTLDNDIQYRIELEANLHKDIIQVDMIDDYYQLGKKAAALFYWIDNNCPEVDFVLKIDDDVYVNVRNLATTVALHISPFSNFMYGQDYADLVPMREGKWEVNVKTWPWKEYPNYFSGACILIPGKMVKLMLAAVQTTPYFLIDDLYLTGLCVAHANIQRRRSEQFFRFEIEPEPCSIRESVSWLFFSNDEILAFYHATDSFYNNQSQCILSKELSTSANPDDVVPIEFFPIELYP